MHGLPTYDTKQKQTAKASFQQPSNLSYREKEAVRWYQEHGYSPINGDLLGINPEFKMPSRKEMQQDYGFYMSTREAVEQLDKVIAKAPLRKKTIYVYRGEKNANRAKKLADTEVGDSYINTAFQSNSLGPSYAFYAFSRQQNELAVLSMIKVSPSVPGAYISDKEHTEMEFLIRRDVKYTLIDKRIIPNKNRGHPVKEILLLVWKAS